MKITVWTLHNPRRLEARPKCIFMGDTDIIPREGDYVVCREGFCCETVRSVSIDLVRKEAEIKVNTCDPEDAYGPCLEPYNRP